MSHLATLFAIFLVLVPPVNATGLSELSDDQVLKGLNGYAIEGYSSAALELELKGGGARAFVERCKNNDELRKMMVDFPRMVTDPDLKEDIILYVLREDSIWDDDQKLSQALIMRANVFAFPALAGEFGLQSDPENASLALCLLSTEGRERLSRLYGKLLQLERPNRSAQNPRMIDLGRAVTEVVSTYGTDEYLRGGGDRKSSVRSVERRLSNGAEGDNGPKTIEPREINSSPADKGEIGGPNSGGGGRTGVVVLVLVLVLATSGFAFFRSRANKMKC